MPPSVHFKDDGLRVFPKKGDAIMWPNADLDNIYRQHSKTIHAAEPLAAGAKWAGNAWIHLRDFKTPHSKGLTG